MNKFGFTNNDTKLAAAKAFRDAAVADGWSIEPIYKLESVDRAAKLDRDGWTMMILSRDDSAKGNKWKHEADVTVWAPDGLCIKVPTVYDFPVMQANIRRCNYCDRTDVPTERVSFAGRCCAACLPTQRAIHEKPGWSN